MLAASAGPADPVARHHHGGGGATSAPGQSIELLSSIAMMVPLAIPSIRHVAFASLWLRRGQAMFVFLVGYLGVWIVVTTLLLSATTWVESTLGLVTSIALTASLTARWQVTRIKRRALRRCERTMPLAPRGWRADRDCARFGVAVAAACVVNCWAIMAMVLALHHHPLAMLLAQAALLLERFGRHAFADVTRVIAAELRSLGATRLKGVAPHVS